MDRRDSVSLRVQIQQVQLDSRVRISRVRTPKCHAKAEETVSSVYKHSVWLISIGIQPDFGHQELLG